MIQYQNTAENLSADSLKDFFVGWPNPPTSTALLDLLKNSDKFVVAVDADKNIVVGFVTAITDKVLSAYIPFLEVLPEYQKQGIGKTLMEKIMESLKDFYMVDLMCDKELQGFYSQFNMQPSTGMILRNYEHQSGRKSDSNS